MSTSSDRDPVSPLVALELAPAPATLVTGQPSESIPVVSSVDGAVARAAPLYLLHAAFRI